MLVQAGVTVRIGNALKYLENKQRYLAAPKTAWNFKAGICMSL